MANAIRSGKSSSDWSDADLIAYNIAISSVPPDQFFLAGDDLSLDHLDSAILNVPAGEDDPSLSEAVTEYLGYIDLATRATQESAINDFAAETLKLLGFKKRNIIVRTCNIIPLTICGENNRVAQTDVCLLHRSTMVLLVLIKDKSIYNKSNPQPQVVAGAIAAFQFNNTMREENGLVPIDAMTIPCITMAGTRPTFYLVPVTEELSTAVKLGCYPVMPTQVLKCVTLRTGPVRRRSEGMEDPNYRKLALKRLLAFKTLARSYWEQFLVGL